MQRFSNFFQHLNGLQDATLEQNQSTKCIQLVFAYKFMHLLKHLNVLPTLQRWYITFDETRIDHYIPQINSGNRVFYLKIYDYSKKNKSTMDRLLLFLRDNAWAETCVVLIAMVKQGACIKDFVRITSDFW